MRTRSMLSGALLAGGLLVTGSLGPALAHHGWSWTEDGFFELTGVVEEVYVGNPHATLDLEVEGETWRVELAPPGPLVLRSTNRKLTW